MHTPYDSSHQDGLAGRPYTGGSYDSYLQGQTDRQNGELLGAGGSVAMALVFIVYVLVIALYVLMITALVAAWTALTSVVGALVLMAFVRVWQRAPALPFLRAFRTCFLCVLVYLLTTTAVVGAWLLLDNGVRHRLAEQLNAALQEVFLAGGHFTIANVLSAFLSNAGGHTGFLLAVAGVLLGPGSLAAAGVLRRHVPEVFDGLRGYMRAVVVLVPAVLFSWLIAVLVERSQLVDMSTVTLKVAVFVVALLGGL